MQRVYDSFAEQHDLRLVSLAALICIATCLISMNLFVRANDAARDRPLPWLFVAATIFGAGVWATNFIAELAFEPISMNSRTSTTPWGTPPATSF
jgi:diguanylate cyclase